MRSFIKNCDLNHKTVTTAAISSKIQKIIIGPVFKNRQDVLDTTFLE